MQPSQDQIIYKIRARYFSWVTVKRYAKSDVSGFLVLYVIIQDGFHLGEIRGEIRYISPGCQNKSDIGKGTEWHEMMMHVCMKMTCVKCESLER